MKSATSQFNGVSIKNIPKDTEPGEIINYLVKSGLPIQFTENIDIKENGNVIVTSLENEICNLLLRNIHLSKQFNKKLICRGIIPMSPEVSTQQESVNNTVINFVSENLEGSYIQQSQLSSEKSDETRVAPNPFSGAGEAELGEMRDHGDMEGGLVLSTPSTSEVLAVIEAS